MMRNFDKDLFIKNIYFLLKEKELKIGQIEERLGVSTGYFSRLKDSVNANPSIELVCSISELFNISIDRLLYSDLSGLNVGVNYILNAVDILMNKIKNADINWDFISKESFYSQDSISYDYLTGKQCTNQILSAIYRDGTDLKIVYESQILDGSFKLADDIIWFENESDRFYFIKLIDKKMLKENDYFYELYLHTKTEFEGICYANKDENPNIYEAIEKLFLYCKENKNAPKLRKNAKKAFEKLMNK